MTDEYFYIEEISPNSSEIDSDKSGDKKCTKERGDSFPMTEKQSQEIRLHEIEQQLSMAESRCNTLKGQVDYMKMLYNGRASNKDGKDVGKVSKTTGNLTKPSTARRHLVIDNGTMRIRNDSDAGKLRDTKYSEEPPSRERDVDQHQAINNISKTQRDRGDRSGAPCERDASAAVKSINNIISGITHSVNRLTQLQVHIGSSSTNNNNNDPLVGIQTVKCSPRYADQNSAAEKPYHQTEINEKPSSDSMKSKTFKKKRRLKGKSSSRQSMASVNETKKRIKVTAKHIEKKTKINPSFTGADLSHVTVNRIHKKPFGKLRTISSRTVLMKKSYNAYNNKGTNNNTKPDKDWKSDKLIELYHNSNARNITASEDSLHNNKKPTNKLNSETKTQLQQPDQVLPAPYEKPETCPNIQSQYRPPLSPINERGIHCGGSYYKYNYELPTIASKMKQVAKSYFQNFSFRTIPFVGAKSTTPSHNLGVNIQQVLSIIKGRKPVAGISPTLAYNIELAANKLGSRPLSALVSNLGSRMHSNKNMCPLSRRYPFSHLQEMAKDIPEETIEEINAAYDEDGIKIPTEHTMAAGDKDDENVQEKNWYMDSKKSEKCTCLPKQGVSFNDVYTKFFNDGKAPNRTANVATRVRHRPWNENRRVKPIPPPPVLQQPFTSISKCSQINKREKSLKEVLKNLHDEFATLNDRYEDLKGQVGNVKGNSSHLLIDIEKMEKDLQNKEDEITMVMTLYKEVMSLKQQVKVLKTRASQSTVVVSPFINRNREYKDLNAAGHLTKLLRHIQQFQDTLKKPNVK